MGSAQDAKHMRRAIDLARLGGGWVNPNPQVGCVIVARGGEASAEGYHHAFGLPHAEREALAEAAHLGLDLRGATVYVTLEPCAHYGKTPPCADALIEAGVARVVIGSADPNPLVAGRGVRHMRACGIEVEEGFMQSECDALNAPFFHFIETGMPLVIAKFAMTLDGKMATRTGKSRWITGDTARQHVHESRARFAGVMVGVGTVIRDNPLLNVRLEEAETALCAPYHQPARIIVDSNLRTPLDCALVQTARDQRTLIVTTNADAGARRPYEEAGCELVTVGCASSGHVDLHATLKELGVRQLDSVIVEGGETLRDALFDAGLVNRVQAYLAPKVFAGVDDPADAAFLGCATLSRLGLDYLIEGDLS